MLKVVLSDMEKPGVYRSELESVQIERWMETAITISIPD
jgi:hypothetical protein